MSGGTTVATDATRRKFRMGIMCHGTTFEAWQANCIRKVLATGTVEFVVLIVDAATTPSKPVWLKIRGLQRNRYAAWNLYQRLFVRGRSRAMESVDMAPEMEDVPVVRCVAQKRGKWARYFKPDEIAEIRRYDLDFVLRFAFNIIKGEILTTPRWGVWSFHHDDLDVYRGPPACFWPLALGDVLQGATLQRLTDGIDNGVVLARAWFAAIRHSYVRNMDRAFFASAEFPARVCRDLWAGTAAYMDAPPTATAAPNRTYPDNLQTLLFPAASHGGRSLMHGRGSFGTSSGPWVLSASPSRRSCGTASRKSRTGSAVCPGTQSLPIPLASAGGARR